jgi:hypothetical protein
MPVENIQNIRLPGRRLLAHLVSYCSPDILLFYKVTIGKSGCTDFSGKQRLFKVADIRLY